MPKNRFLPQVMGDRPEYKHSVYRQHSNATSLSEVNVTHSMSNKPHSYSVPDGEGIVSRRLRRYGLALARYSLPTAKYAKRWGYDEQIIKHTNAIVATTLYRVAYNDDPTDGTFGPEPLIAMLQEPTPPMPVIIQMLAMFQSRHFEAMRSALLSKHPEYEMLVNGVVNDLTRRTTSEWYQKHLTRINSPESYDRRQARKIYKGIADALNWAQEQVAETRRQDKRQRDAHRRHRKTNKVVRTFESGSDGWVPLRVAKPELDIPHSGLAGRRRMATDTGRKIRYPERLYTDPLRRAFVRKTRALGGVVVVDCSGSMGLTQDDLNAIMRSSAGCTVLCYSSSMYDDEEKANAWVVARNGRQVRALPQFPGGNGVDGPALVYAATQLRRNGMSPIVWISDGQVTGKGDRTRSELKEECKAIQNRFGIPRVPDVASAIKHLRKLQGRG
jgi:hypothetical protein